ncbi:hypothetical protein Bbelb_395720 [Branchiostoma belcheri]|nr:hypothetical protein Bbelb_395720 [Branchiostoma belcheri]
MSSIPLSGLGLFISIITIKIDGNPWQCDCRMTPFRLNLAFNEQIVCTQPDKVKGQKLTDVNPEELICEEPTISTLTSPRTITSDKPTQTSPRTITSDKPTQTSPLTTSDKPKSVPSNTLSVLIGVFCGSLPGLVLTGITILTVWYKIKTRIPPLGLHPIGYEDVDNDDSKIGQGQRQSFTESDTNTTTTLMTSGYDQTGQGQSQTITESNTNTTATVMTSGYDQTGQGQSQTITESNTNTTATVIASGHD